MDRAEVDLALWAQRGARDVEKPVLHLGQSFLFLTCSFATPTLEPARDGLSITGEQCCNGAITEALDVQAHHLKAARVNV